MRASASVRLTVSLLVLSLLVLPATWALDTGEIDALQTISLVFPELLTNTQSLFSKYPDNYGPKWTSIPNACYFGEGMHGVVCSPSDRAIGLVMYVPLRSSFRAYNILLHLLTAILPD